MKNNFKLFAFLFIFIATAVTLCGCAEVNFVTYNNADGSIDEYIELTINPEALLKHGYNPEQVMMEIKTDSYTEADILLDFYHNKLSTELTLGKINNNEYTELFSGVKITEQYWQDYRYVIGLSYTSSAVYKKYYELVNNSSFSSAEPERVEKFFYTKTYYRGTTNFGDYSIFYRIYDYYANSRFATISPQNTTLTYSYSVNTRRMHSDANHVTLDSNGNYIHTWNVSLDNPNKIITFYTISANRAAWIGTCLTAGLTTCIILCIIAIIKHRENVRKNIEQLKQNTNSNTNNNQDND